jgi:hypothetical protein
MTQIWRGDRSWSQALSDGTLKVDGSTQHSGPSRAGSSSQASLVCHVPPDATSAPSAPSRPNPPSLASRTTASANSPGHRLSLWSAGRPSCPRYGVGHDATESLQAKAQPGPRGARQGRLRRPHRT